VVRLALAGLAAAALGCAASPPVPRSGSGPARLAPCPPTPNCVTSEGAEPSQRVESFVLDPRVEPAVAWAAVREAVAGLPRTRIADEAPGYLRAESRSALFRFVDDLELALEPGARRIAVRSASRVGRSDLGVNRRRVERLREALRGASVAR
jgi:uncharacterized protein (DUF1499 family)